MNPPLVHLDVYLHTLTSTIAPKNTHQQHQVHGGALEVAQCFLSASALQQPPRLEQGEGGAEGVAGALAAAVAQEKVRGRGDGMGCERAREGVGVM